MPNWLFAKVTGSSCSPLRNCHIILATRWSSRYICRFTPLQWSSFYYAHEKVTRLSNITALTIVICEESSQNGASSMLWDNIDFEANIHYLDRAHSCHNTAYYIFEHAQSNRIMANIELQRACIMLFPLPIEERAVLRSVRTSRGRFKIIWWKLPASPICIATSRFWDL